jgi:AraC-like DNA-binding protein
MGSAAVQNVQLVLAAAMSRGIPPAKLLGEIGLLPQQLIDADGRVPVETALRAWQVAAELSGDPGFGLSVMEYMHPGLLGSLAFAVHGSATLGDGLRRLARFFRVVNQLASLAVLEDGPRMRVRVEVDHEVPADELRHPMECLLSTLLMVGRRSTGTPLQPLAVSFRHAAPHDLAAHRRAFGVAPSFGQPSTELVFPRQVLDLPHLAPDDTLVAVAERHLRRMLDEIPPADTFADRVRRVLLEELRLGEPTLPRLAARMHMSERTLQRNLGREGASMQALLDEVRHQLSLRHLAESKESIAEISFLLGFAEVRAFHRAFKRWTGLTPAAYRQTRATPASAP